MSFQRTAARSYRDLGAFTLVEILVAMAVLALTTLILVGILDSTTKVSNSSNKKMSADSGGRQTLDRIRADFTQAILRHDLQSRITKNVGNDTVTFFAQTDGYGGNRGISKISYDVSDNILRRGAEGTRWDTGERNLIFGEPTPEAVTQDDFSTVSDEVFRFETAFLLNNGEIVAKVGSINAKDTPPEKRVRAMIAGIAVLDKKTQKLLTTDGDAASLHSLNALSSKFPDARDGEDILTTWQSALEGSGFPSPVISNTRIYQRYYYLWNTP